MAFPFRDIAEQNTDSNHIGRGALLFPNFGSLYARIGIQIHIGDKLYLKSRRLSKAADYKTNTTPGDSFFTPTFRQEKPLQILVLSSNNKRLGPL